MKEIGAFFKGFLAVGEEKVSTLVVCFAVTLGFALYMFLQTKTIDVNMCNLLIAFICSIAGINLPSSIGAVLTTIQQYKDTTTSSTNSTENK
jgi:hypothetical protein